MTRHALIVGAGSGISAAFARALAEDGTTVALAARNPDKLAGLVEETGGRALACDVSDRASVEAMFSQLDGDFGPLDLVHYNPSRRFSGPLVELDPDDVLSALKITAYGGFLVAQQAARRMLERGEGAIFFTGASASVKGYAKSAPFAMGKFALRGLAQSMARELHPQNVHIAHFVIDGGVRSEARGRVDSPDTPDAWLDPAAIADTYLHVFNQPRSVWTWEVELRPWVERF
ncbi:MAG: SDR family NAD(P)-dependent oxidoreductase [Hyphomicrobiales bacterium]|nr:SDR family NAD(P)-dependent oxidoreductase [Hyphomicrobiales bacterium]